MRALGFVAAVALLTCGASCSSDSGGRADGGGGAAGSGTAGIGGSGGGAGAAGTGGVGGTGGVAGAGGGIAGTGGDTAGRGGAVAGTGGGTAGSGGVVAGSGGAAGRGGSGGSAGAGGVMNTGAAGNPGGCPASVPTVGEACTANGTAICNYAGATCACRMSGTATVWTCVSCPEREPANNTACTQPPGTNIGGVSCPYQNDFCACRTDSLWYCRCMGCP